MSVTAIILAGGTGKRMKGRTPKQFLELAGKPVIVYSMEVFEKNPLISHIVIVSHPDYLGKVKGIAIKYKIGKLYKVVEGGKTRQASSFQGVKNCPEDTKFVLIHDAARPFVDDKIIADTLRAAKASGASGAAIQVDDTIIIEKNGGIDSIPDRRRMKRIQTPQGFKYSLILAAHQKALKNGITDSTDDCGLVLKSGGRIKISEGSKNNIKLTDRLDMRLAEVILTSWVR